LKTSTNIPKAPGIYRISIGPRTFYWGQAQSLGKRRDAHIHHLRRGIHHNSRLQRSFDKHGEAAFTFEVSLLCPVEDLDMQEQFCLDTYHGTPGCANVAKCAEASGRGLVRSEATKAKIAEAHRGVPKSAEHRAKLAEARRGVASPVETRAKIAEAHRGVPKSAEHAAAIREGQWGLHPNIRVEYTNGTLEVWPSQSTLAAHLGLSGNGAISNWLYRRNPIPAKYNILSVSYADLPATINPEAI